MSDGGMVSDVGLREGWYEGDFRHCETPESGPPDGRLKTLLVWDSPGQDRRPWPTVNACKLRSAEGRGTGLVRTALP